MSQPAAHVITRSRLAEWVGQLLKQAQVIAPRTVQGGDTAYDAVEDPSQVAWDYSVSINPLKRFLLPQTEELLRWRRPGGDGLQLEPTYDETERIFLAVRSCDVSGVLFLDRVFSRDPEDIYYMTRRQNSALVSLTCGEPGEDCFCVCANAGPFLENGYDLQLTNLSDDYLVEVGTEKGRSLIAAAEHLFAAAPEELIRARRDIERDVEERFEEHKAYFAAALRKVTFDRVPDELWDGMADRCLECGGCSFVCPTCTCFLVADYPEGESGHRERLWDSCLYSCYTLEASGHNPRAQRRDRVKARFFHKLSYQFAKELEAHGCVGCGRCITACLGSNDMPTVTARIRRGAI